MNARKTLDALLLTLAGGCLVLGMTACDDDAGADADAAPATTVAAAPTSCSLAEQVLATPMPDVGPDTAPEVAGPLFQAYARSLAEPAASLVDAVPGSLHDAAAAVADALAGVADSGDPTLLFDPATGDARSTLAAGEADACGWASLDAAGHDYRFDGLPSDVDAGPTVLTLTNDSEGGEPHELVLFRMLDDTAAEDLLAMDPAEAGNHIERVQSVFVPAPGLSASTVVDLDAGSYVAMCLVPVGTHGEQPGDGPPHAMAGMTATFTAR